MDEILEFLSSLEGKKILLLTHHNADVDALCSAWVLKNFLRRKNSVKIASCESLAKQTRNILTLINEEIEIDPDCSAYELVFVLDTSSKEQIKTAKNLEKIHLLIDHHEKGDLRAEMEIVDSNAKATCILVYRILKALGYNFSELERKLLVAGIVADTAHLRFANREVFSTLAELVSGFEFRDVLKLLTIEEDLSDKIATLKAAKRMDVFKFGELIVVFSRLGSHEAVASRNLLKIGADIAIVITKKENELRISSRGKEKILEYGVNLAVLFEKVGKFIHGSGGGHDLAGSANGKIIPYKKVVSFILRELSKTLGKYKKVKA